MSTNTLDSLGFIVSHDDEKLSPKVLEAFLKSRKRIGKWEEKRTHAWKDVPFANFHKNSSVKKKMKQLIREMGIPSSIRANVWMEISGAKLLKENSNINSESGCYYLDLVRKNELKKKHLEVYEYILKDLPRTFPNHESFSKEETLEKMERILLAYARRNKNLGYCQGMNFLTGFLLLATKDEEDSFWLLTALVENIFPGYYSRTMSGSRIDIRVLGSLVNHSCPQLIQHFANQYVNLALIGTKWCICLFIGNFPTDTTLQLWDRIFLDGVAVLFRAMLTLLHQCQEHLLNVKDPAEIIKTLESHSATLFEYKDFFLAINNLGNINLESLSSVREQEKKDLEIETQEIKKRRDISQLSNLTRFSPKEIEDIRKQFLYIAKKNRSHLLGEISFSWAQFVQAFCTVFPSWNKSNPALKNIFKAFDTNGDGQIDFRELMVGLSILTRGSIQEKIELCFNTFDLDKSGDISKDEMKFMIQTIYATIYGKNSLSEEDIRKFVDKTFANLDTDKNGTLSLQEFRNIIIVEPQLIESFFTSLGLSVDETHKKSTIQLTSNPSYYVQLEEEQERRRKTNQRRKNNCIII